MISKTLSTSVCYARLFEVCPDLAEFAQSLYPLLVSHADDFGREQGDLLTVKYRIHPLSPRSVDEFGRAMTALHDVGLIRWYSARGRQCYEVCKFEEHQIGLHKRTRSQFPTFPGNSGNVPESPGQQNRTKENRTKGKKDQEKSSTTSVEPADAVLVFPTIGKPTSWPLTAQYAIELGEAYPGINVVAEARKAHAWIKANRPKTARGMPAFLVRWLNKAADRGPAKPLRSEPSRGHQALRGADWRAECERLHGGRCTNVTFHEAQMEASADGVH